MKNELLHNVNIRRISPLPTPAEIKSRYKLTEIAKATVLRTREEVKKILLGEDPRLLIGMGPCSLSNVEEMFCYAKELAPLAKKFKDKFLVLLRLCGDKPRTHKDCADWTGFLNDPHMNGSCDIVYGWQEFRKLAIKILELGLPICFEYLDRENYQRLDDLPSYVWIGARTVADQNLSKVASGISVSVGAKNHNIAGIELALNAMNVITTSNVFVAPNDNGISSRFLTKGNKFAHLIHRGMDSGTNYDARNINNSINELVHRGFLPRIVIDVSHGNSRKGNSPKNHLNQAGVIKNISKQITSGSPHIAGILYESFLKDGNQPIPLDLSDLKPGLSVTDACDGWERSEKILRDLYHQLS